MMIKVMIKVNEKRAQIILVLNGLKLNLNFK